MTIESVTLEADGEATLSVRELQAFVIRASLIHHEPTPGVSVNINIIRSDGAYVFYQPSGLEGRNIVASGAAASTAASPAALVRA